ncbi:hypothetical protein BIWAKO_04633 [Bosea sp. BIWAKO-01]|nr:hypothetical protein BIWAKO_04633 [Bosea sp. BIWAKO-01]
MGRARSWPVSLAATGTGARCLLWLIDNSQEDRRIALQFVELFV